MCILYCIYVRRVCMYGMFMLHGYMYIFYRLLLLITFFGFSSIDRKECSIFQVCWNRDRFQWG